ncbi:SUPPRESSOR OF npr1-1 CONSTITUTIVE 1 protein [Nymphaea thermarum]|nr:SUPPRESSOR OF npr1-1 CONSTITUTIVE 1 protein [Nymphaea thermarum]
MAIVIEALAEKAISSLLEAVTSLLREKVDLILNAKDELKKLQRKLERLEVSLKDVDHKPFFSSERDRYLEGELKDVFYDAQDIIEKYQTEIKISKWEKDSLTSWNKVRKPWITLCSCFKEHVHDSYKFSIETKKINERLDAIKKDREMVDLLKTTPSRRFEDPVHGEHDNSRETTHHMGAQPPTGREDDKRETVKRLLSDESAHSSMTKKGSVSIISIVGKGGIGKTTLAKMVFSEIEQHFGERRWWVCVSERPNREDLLQKILKEVHKKSKEDINSSLSLGELCTQLRNELSKEKFLLVLDDVWELNWWEEEVGGTLMAGAMGSKILITSRKKDVSVGMGGEEYSHASASQRTRHMSLLRVNNVEETMHNVTATTHKLRTLLSKSIPSAYLTYFKWLRILSLMEYRMEELPNSIGDLALLKYLDLSNSNVRRLPSSIGRLCNLQTLDLRHSCIEELPKEMGELCNLRYLGLKPTFCLKFIAEGLGKLTNLQTLHRFLVCDDKGDTNGCDIRELKDLNKLKGGLSIEGLGGSRKAIDDVGNAQLLKEKHGITSLEFSFGIIGGDDEQSGVMEALEPPLGLECLKISYYKGQMPAWHLKAEYYTMLQTLVLERCFLWEKIISIASLKVLHVTECPELCEIAGMSALESLGVNECGSLEQLTHDMPALKWLMVKCCSSLKTISNMHALLSLEVSWCGSLEQLPHDMPALKSLKVERCDSLKALVNMHALESLEAKDCRSLKELPHHMPALESLNVSYCGRLEQLPHHMPALKSLKVEQCHMLKTVANTPALESLKVSWCDKLEQLPHHMPALKSLKVEGCNWEGWPAGRSEETTLTSMPRLREANFMNCPKMQIEGLIDELPGLQILIVSECPSARLGWKLLQQLPNLIHLQLDPKSAVLVPSPLPSQVSTFLPSLKSLDLNGNRNVDKVEWGRVPEWVWNLSQLEKLGLRHFSEDFSLGGHWQCLPKLRELSLWRLPNLKSLVDVNNVTMHQNEDDSVAKASPMDANEQIACLSKLEKLEIFLCPSLRLPQELRDHLGERLSIRGRRG